jgi:Fur family transcriptional regulator, ferric uptake regulator
MTAPDHTRPSRRPDGSTRVNRSEPAIAAIHTAVSARLKNVDGRYTKRRRAIVDALAHAQQPLTVEEIRTIADVPQSSIYRNLTVLEEAQLVHRFINNNSEFARYELAEELTGHHHHFACDSCGTMTDVTLPNNIESDLDNALTLLAAQQRFTINGHRLDIIGTCQTCTDGAR